MDGVYWTDWVISAYHAAGLLGYFVNALSLSNKERDDDDDSKDTAAGMVSAHHRHLTLSSSEEWRQRDRVGPGDRARKT